MRLHFDEASHTYSIGGAVLPNVTRILAPLVDYSMIPRDALERAKQEGKAVHTMVELDDHGTLDVAGLPEWMAPVYKAWCEFKEISGYRPVLAECKVYHRRYNYAGTLDKVCELPKLKGWPGESLLDVKRSLYAGAVIGLQTSAYEQALISDPSMPKPKRRGALRLAKDGKFRLEPYDDKADFSVFLSLLNIHRWKEKHGLAQ